MELTDDDKLQLRKMLSTQWWRILEEIIQKKIKEFDKQINVNAHDYTKVREKKYDDLNITGAMIRGMSLVLKAPYDAVNQEAKDNLIAQMNDHYMKEVKKLER